MEASGSIGTTRERAFAAETRSSCGFEADELALHGSVICYGNIIGCGETGKQRRGGYVFITWKGDHPPRHVHVYRDGKLVVKWDLDNKQAMKGTATRRVLQLIAELESEGVL